MAMSGRRLRILWVGREAFWQLFLDMTARGPRGFYPVATNVPEGCKAVEVCFNYERDAFGIKLEHPSFDDVPEGEALPWAEPLGLEWREVKPPAANSPKRGREFL